MQIKDIPNGHYFYDPTENRPACRHRMATTIGEVDVVTYFSPVQFNVWMHFDRVKDREVTPLSYQEFIISLVQQVL